MLKNKTVMSFKRISVVMLPTNEKASIIDLTGNKILRVYKEKFSYWINDKNIFYNLYFLSDEEIKEGDLRLDEKTGKTWRINNEHTFNHPSGYKMLKIIATTDKSLNLPQPSDSFLEKYVEEYNKGNIISEVMVEYDYRVKSGTIDEHKKGLAGYEYFELKVNPKDNTITIRKVKDSWNRDEVEEKIREGAYVLLNGSLGDFDKWIEENL